MKEVEEWEIFATDEVREWADGLDHVTYDLVARAIDRLAAAGPGLGRPLVDRIEGSRIHNLKELRPGSAGRSEIRVLFVFDPWRSAILLVAGDKSGDWKRWYSGAVQRAEELYELYPKERAIEEEGA
ncbi:type II toxin-antitoxin system RelE/ParE family toxin [Actinomadura sp. 9N407]|uniref:type II toxin-antitoxin system RelE/ParE family toxin n=1 Tax=Actinomadura sp. 9N407 TaxID=3375154 RepID=UPI003794C861